MGGDCSGIPSFIMLNFLIYPKEGRYLVRERNNQEETEIPPKYLNQMYNILRMDERCPRIGKQIEILLDQNETIQISEYDLLQMIKIFYVWECALSCGKFWIEFYQNEYKEAEYELGKILPK